MTLRIGCLVGIHYPMVREVLAVLAAYRQQRDWTLLWTDERQQAHSASSALKAEPCDVLITSRALPANWRTRAAHTVGLGLLGDDGDYRIAHDNQALAQQCFRHLNQRGVAQFGLVSTALPKGAMRPDGTTVRHVTLRQLVDASGSGLAELGIQGDASWNETTARLAQWLKGQALPLGIITDTISQANVTLQACTRAQLKVPQQVRIMALADEEPLGDLSTPSISAGLPHQRGIGHRLVQLLDAIDAGKTPSWRCQLVPPLGVMARGSTGSIITGLPDIDGYLSDNPYSSSTALAEALGVSPRHLQRQVKEACGRSLTQLQHQCRMEQALALLYRSDRPLGHLAHQLGYHSVQAFSRAFRAWHHQSPQAWRQQLMLRAPSITPKPEK